MRIAQVSPLYESVPPPRYGGTERIVSYITEELVEQGHDVTLFASGDSTTKARLVAPCGRALRSDRRVCDPLAQHYLLLEEVFERAELFDIIHFHIDYLHFPLARRQSTPHLTTLHGRLDIADLKSLYRKYPDMPVVSISNAQREPLARANWRATVYHGLPPKLFAWRQNTGDYLAFLGRISPEKRPDRAIEIARRAGMPLKIAAKIDAVDQAYMECAIRPLLRNSDVEFIGEINQEQKGDFLANAYALLFPIDWPEPFGLVVIEAMACGTPVIAFRGGSVPELIDEGVTGFIVADIDGAVEALGKVPYFDRRRCRMVFEDRFSSARMVRDYLAIYRRLIAGSADHNGCVAVSPFDTDALQDVSHYHVQK